MLQTGQRTRRGGPASLAEQGVRDKLSMSCPCGSVRGTAAAIFLGAREADTAIDYVRLVVPLRASLPPCSED